MASLRDKLKRVKVGGQLQEVSEEEIQSLSAAAGRPLPPTTPQETGVIGGSPDQAKMAGTPAQKTSALRLGIQGEQRLQDTLRRQQARTGATAEEAERLSRGERLQQLGGLQGRVQALSEQLTAQAAQQEGQNLLALQEDRIAQLPEEQQASVQNLLGQLQTDPNNAQLLKDLNNALGITRVENMLTSENLQQYFQGAGQQVGAQAAEAFQDTATVADLDLTELGFDDAQELATLLGVSAEELQGLSIRDIIEETEAQIEEEHTQVADLQARAQNPNLGPAERAEARKLLRDMGAVGVRAAETEIDKFAESIANADTVEFAGQDIAIGDMLEDEYISGLAQAYLDPNADPEFKAQLEESEPELTQWFGENKALLDEAVGQLESGLSEFAKMQYENQKLADTAIGQRLSDEIMAEMFEDWGELKVESYDKPPVIEALTEEGGDKNEQAQLYKNLTELHEISPDITKEFSTLSRQELQEAGATAPTGTPAAQKFEQYKQYRKDVKNLQTLNPETATSDEIAQVLVGPGATWETVQEKLSGIREMDNSGLFGKSPTGFYLNLTGDPQQDAAWLRGRFLKNGKEPQGLRDLVNKGAPRSMTGDFQKNQAYKDKAKSLYGVDWRKVAPAFRNDGIIEPKEVTRISKNLADKNEFERLWKSPLKNKLGKGGTMALMKEYDNRFRGQLIGNITGRKAYNTAIKAMDKDYKNLTFEDYTNARDVKKALLNKYYKAEGPEKYSLRKALNRVQDIESKWNDKKSYDKRRDKERRKREKEEIRNDMIADLAMGGVWTKELAKAMGVDTNKLGSNISKGRFDMVFDQFLKDHKNTASAKKFMDWVARTPQGRKAMQDTGFLKHKEDVDKFVERIEKVDLRDIKKAAKGGRGTSIRKLKKKLRL